MKISEKCKFVVYINIYTHNIIYFMFFEPIYTNEQPIQHMRAWWMWRAPAHASNEPRNRSATALVAKGMALAKKKRTNERTKRKNRRTPKHIWELVGGPVRHKSVG